jgi:hypothetical protein
MNLLLPRAVKSAYRKEPLSAFILIVGLVDILLGAAGQRLPLLSFGVLVALIALLVRWLQIQKAKEILVENNPRYFLPPSAANNPLPMLINEKQRR